MSKRPSRAPTNASPFRNATAVGAPRRRAGLRARPDAAAMRRAGTGTTADVPAHRHRMAMLYEEISAAAPPGPVAVVATTNDSPRTSGSRSRRRCGGGSTGWSSLTARAGAAADLSDAVPQVLALRSDGVRPAALGDDPRRTSPSATSSTRATAHRPGRRPRLRLRARQAGGLRGEPSPGGDPADPSLATGTRLHGGGRSQAGRCSTASTARRRSSPSTTTPPSAMAAAHALGLGIPGGPVARRLQRHPRGEQAARAADDGARAVRRHRGERPDLLRRR